MTLIVAWREASLERVWIASDSRLSQGRAAGHVRLTDSGAKLLTTELVLRRPAPQMPIGIAIHRRNVAFAYAGSSLIALQVYASILPLWSHLETSGEEILPTMRECAEHLAYFLVAYTREVSSAQNALQPCECVIIGYDDDAKRVMGWSIRAGVAGCDIEADIREIDLSPGAIALFGSGADDMRERLASLSSGINASRRQPLETIRQLLAVDRQTDVGGGVQFGCVTESGFELFFDVQPDPTGSIMPSMRFRGFDFTQISQVGGAFVNLRGVA